MLVQRRLPYYKRYGNSSTRWCIVFYYPFFTLSGRRKERKPPTHSLVRSTPPLPLKIQELEPRREASRMMERRDKRLSSLQKAKRAKPTRVWRWCGDIGCILEVIPERSTVNGTLFSAPHRDLCTASIKQHCQTHQEGATKLMP